jgi:hypothetical protein
MFPDAASDTPSERRTFIRLIAFGSIAWIGTVLLRRSCDGKGVCNGCGSYTGCALPWKVAQR